LAINSSQQSRQVVLINSELDSLATHFMSTIALLQGVFDQPESKHRAFLWYGKIQDHWSMLPDLLGNGLEAAA
jgi:hypothetical protein